MSFQRNKTFILIIIAVAALLVASPFLQQLAIAPQTEYFTEMALLDSNHKTDYPSNATSGKNYKLYIEITNHLGHAADYTVEAKFRDASQPGPDSFKHTSSSLPPLERFTVSADDNQTVELPLEVSLQFSSSGYVDSLTINGKTHNINTQIEFDSQKNNYYSNIFFELWVYNQTTNKLQYHERYISLWLKMIT
ncbi:MAG: DUF1616 domain-containing protein [Nitrososphaerota archaeon]|jgi:uncharacterized membrane protein|uniref:DUF1616 domain-containing protein n=1 Tax=Candidatus Bathycorpusculum sp. TaxID=2994959 RepID=UPI00282FF59B|nr:DUF1616 domain-containing protein [Candidatus Termitimicrobium sp.]MCL2431321.1 DUF1616 domain-containing protein [Candidatus Termitimicrobium sp.]MDR0493812.1 DUF1616 domain-containing protein [Nitrososphaerota archaeon]